MSIKCEWCGCSFERRSLRGPVPKYCNANHRQRAYEARRAMKAFAGALPKIDMAGFGVSESFFAEAFGLTKAMESVTAPMREAFSTVSFDRLEGARRDAVGAMEAFAGALPKIDMAGFGVSESFFAEAFGLTKAMESVTAPMREAFSTVSFDRLEGARRDAVGAMEAFAGALPKIDMAGFGVADALSVDALLSVFKDDALVSARELVDSLYTRPLIESSVEDLIAARGVWNRVDREVDSLRSALDAELTTTGSDPVVVFAMLASLLAVESTSSQVLLDFALFSLETLLIVLQLAWHMASHPGISGSMNTLGGLAGTISLTLFLRDRQLGR